MTLRGDIRDYFEREAVAFPTPPGLRASVAAEAAGGASVERRGMRLAGAVAVGLSVALIGGLIAAAALHRPSPPVPGVKPGQHGHVLDADALDASNGWALVEQCDAVTCSYWSESTADGGRSWDNPVVIATFPAVDGDAPRHIHFANRQDGWAYGNAVVFATYDGGRSWERTLSTYTGVVAITGRGPVFAVLYPCGKGTQCPYHVLETRDGKTWEGGPNLPQGFMPRLAVAFGSKGLIVSSFGPGDMAVTNDTAQTWSIIPGQCQVDSGENYVTTPDGNEIWQYCGARPAVEGSVGGAKYLAVSEDGGKTWRRETSAPNAVVGSSLLSPAPGTAFLLTWTSVTSPAQLLMSTDAGHSWSKVDSAGDFMTLSFGNGVAWAVDNQSTIWVSYDAGKTWRRLPVQP